MTCEEIVAQVIDALESTGTPYMVVGSLSCNLYAVPRSTQDADFVVEFGDVTLMELMGRLGPKFRLDPQASFETITGTTRHVIDVADELFKIELFQLSDEAHDRERFKRRSRVNVLGRDAYAPTPEDVVVTKIRWSNQGRRSKDLDDARNVITFQCDSLDWDYICRWCDQHGTRKLLDEIRASIPKND